MAQKIRFVVDLNVRFATVSHPTRHLNKSERFRNEDSPEDLTGCDSVVKFQRAKNSNQRRN